MNWDALGATAEIIGAGVVLVTLIYLAIQARDNARVQKAQAIWDAQTSFVEVNELLGDGGMVSELVYRTLDENAEVLDYVKYHLHRFMRGWMQRMARFSGVGPDD